MVTVLELYDNVHCSGNWFKNHDFQWLDQFWSWYNLSALTEHVELGNICDVLKCALNDGDTFGAIWECALFGKLISKSWFSVIGSFLILIQLVDFNRPGRTRYFLWRLKVCSKRWLQFWSYMTMCTVWEIDLKIMIFSDWISFDLDTTCRL